MERVTVEKLVYGGMGLSRTDGRVLMTPFVLPGETAHVEPVDKLHARLVRVEDPSPRRTEPGCPYFGTCGGCHYQHAPYEYQLEQKVAILRETLRRVGGVQAPEHIEVIAGPEWHYRNRVQLHFQNGNVGYLIAGSHQLCPISHCPISSPRINEAIASLARMAKDRRFPEFVESIELFTNEHHLQLNVASSHKPVAKRFFEWCADEIPGYAEGPVQYPTGQAIFRVSPRSFFQVNRFLVDKLMDAAVGNTSGTEALDLYAGVGLFSIALAKRFRSVAGVESSSSAVTDYRGNAERAKVSAAAVMSPVDQYLEHVQSTPDLILADPPRAGLGKVATRHLVRLKPPRLHIVACDPATLARDLTELIGTGGYKIERMILVDLFPQTYHLETIVHLTV
ncbi:MAG TPA: class I SAM-dependent RNA methyltransferase [Bryobacteraceae bacterium]|nr:class I SAM-dependent RNA methyltransferase [Bryobacteraceae bacterium]